MALQIVDHLIYAAPELDAAIDEIEALLGIRPIFGGQHTGRGTHNALLSLGGRSYLEVIAPDPTQSEPPVPRSFGLNSPPKQGRLVTWASPSENLHAQVEQARAAGYDAGTIVDGGRLTSDGVQLNWRSAKRPEVSQGQPLVGGGLIPFLIEWGNTPHPALSSPQGCELIRFSAEHPNPDSIATMFTALNVPISVTQGNQPQLIAIINTPNGQVELR
ncbi:MAG: VOC family protein [Candidatus Promineifilaceae bacterium]